MYLTLSGGGAGGLAFIGAYQALLEKGYKFTGYIGTSVGAIFALLFSLGYSCQEMTRLAYKLEYKDFEDLQILGLLENLGLDRGGGIRMLIQSFILNKTGNANLTFKEHYYLTGKLLQITTFCVDDNQTRYLDHFKTPHMPLYEGIFMSVAIPWVIAAAKFEGKTYIDGGFHNPFPIQGLPPEKTIGIRLNNCRFHNKTVGQPFLDFTINLVGSLLYQTHILARQNTHNYRVIDIDTDVSMFSILLSKQERQTLINKGYVIVENILSK